jgi:hypothetical protein
MVMVVPTGPSPKNWGFWEVSTSPSSTLSRVTVSLEGGVISSETSKPEDAVESSGRSIEALGISLTTLGGRFLKS